MAKLLKCPDGNLVEFTGEIKHTSKSGLATMIIEEATGEEHWIPNSAIEDIETDDSVVSTIYIKEWIAREKGII